MSDIQGSANDTPFSYLPPSALVSPNNIALAVHSERGSNFFTAIVTAAMNFDTGANPLVLPTVYRGLLAKIVNGQATDILVKGSKVGDAGVVCLAGATTVVTDDGNGGLMEVATSGGGSADSGALFTSALAKGQVDANVANLAAFNVLGATAGNDGVTYAQGDIVVLNKQTTVAQNGPYVVGAVVANVAPLMRPAWWATGSAIPSGFEFELSNLGTNYGGLKLLVTAGAGKVVDTDDPVLLFRQVYAKITGGAGPVYSRAKGFASATAITHNGVGDYTLTAGPAGVDLTKMTVNNQIRDGAANANSQTIGITATGYRFAMFVAAVATEENVDVLFNLIP